MREELMLGPWDPPPSLSHLSVNNQQQQQPNAMPARYRKQTCFFSWLNRTYSALDSLVISGIIGQKDYDTF